MRWSRSPEPPPRRGKALRWAGRLALLGASLGLSLVLAEGVVRLLRPQQLIRLRPDVWVPHDGLGWIQAPEIDTRINTGEREVRLLTDGEGHRVGLDPQPPAAYRVLALGDSFLAAIQVEYEQTLTALAEERLTRELQAPVRVVNAAVGGWGPSHYRLKAREQLARCRYDLVVVFLYLGNDVTGKDIETFAPRKATIRHRFHWPRRATWASVVDDLLYPINDVLERRSHLFVLAKNRAWHVLARLGLTARSFPSVLLREEASSDRWWVTSGVCGKLAEEAGRQGVPVLFVLLPGVCEIDREVAESTARAFGADPLELDIDQPSRRMSSELGRRGLAVLDATPALRAAHAAGREDLYGTVDPHFGLAGHEVVAAVLTPRVLEALTARAGIERDPDPRGPVPQSGGRR